MFEQTIRLADIETIKNFNQKISKVKCDVDLLSEHHNHVIDAKSIMGILSLDLSKPVTLRANTDNRDVIAEIKDILSEI